MGKIHSIETMGLVDGPGIRFVVFFQGCLLRCLYCHNPDTWNIEKGQEIGVEELLAKVMKFKPYFKNSGGGVTCSGGEPLLQPEFLIKFLKSCKQQGIHTAIDTAGVGIGHYEKILKYTDLIILDIKHFQPCEYKKITGRNIDEFMQFKKALEKSGKPLWIRHVVVPGFTDKEEDMVKLREFLEGFKNVEKVQLLPYHKLGVEKYKTMGIPYSLTNTPTMNKEELKVLEKSLSDC